MARLGIGLRQALFFLVFGIIIGAVSNEIRRDGLPWAGSWSPPSLAASHLKGLQEISLEEAWELHRAGLALFLDAQDHHTFRQGHLPGALNMAPGEAETYVEDLLAFVESGMQIIAYCDGVDCPLSSGLARSLQELGVPAVRVLINGWSRWLQAGFPIERGGH